MDTIFKPGLFSGKTAIITGGGTGIGFRIASELAQLGATVILASRKKEILDKAAEKLLLQEVKHMQWSAISVTKKA